MAARTAAARVVVRIIRLWRARTRSIAERIRLLPGADQFTGNVPREGRSRLHRRPAPPGAAGPLGLGRRRDSAPTGGVHGECSKGG